MTEPMRADSFDFKERLDVLIALERNLRSSIDSVNQPRIMLDHAAKLERDAQELLTQAMRIRELLTENRESLEEIREQLSECVKEQVAIRFCIQRGIKPKFLRRALLIQKRMEQLDDDNATDNDTGATTNDDNELSDCDDSHP